MAYIYLVNYIYKKQNKEICLFTHKTIIGAVNKEKQSQAAVILKNGCQLRPGTNLEWHCS